MHLSFSLKITEVSKPTDDLTVVVATGPKSQNVVKQKKFNVSFITNY